MSSEEYHEINEMPESIKQALQVYISFLTANFSYDDDIDAAEFALFRETITDGLFDTQHLPMMQRNNIGISGNDLFNAACIMMTDMLYNATSGDIPEARKLLEQMGMAVVEANT